MGRNISHHRTRSTIRNRNSNLPFDMESRTMATRTQSAPSIGTSAAVARGSHDDDSTVIGPTTRSRKRKHNNMAERSIETNPLVASAPSRRKRSSSTAAKRSRVKSSRVIDNRKKPPPGSKKAPPAVAGAKFAKNLPTQRMPLTRNLQLSITAVSACAT